ncbi:MAG: hypothetical protein HN353_07905 [Bdellovibrionales bacterium]|jgi:hypothetical protein|nr:hypothetical protein [Bdellovibrionales bacterium]MBT3525843.1 hypothetical protein [Bdellovibrionales bacterium]MBT7670287.1 hypothetical protein [Bdellovibrionales bacterium]MBT7765666.1 hypothetical protein [Bdellovibrionales bacterium]
MSKKIKKTLVDQDYHNEFYQFKPQSEVSPSHRVDQIILEQVACDLAPSNLSIFIKLLLIQGVVGILTMLFCPQFDLSLTNRYELFHFFHRTFGHYGCMAICGSLFIGSGAAVASIILTHVELIRICHFRFSYYLAISGCAITSFMIISPQAYLDLAAIWYLGATVGGISMIELGKQLRQLQPATP